MGFMPAESDECAEDAVYSVRAADDLIVGLGLDSTQPWLDRVLFDKIRTTEPGHRCAPRFHSRAWPGMIS